MEKAAKQQNNLLQITSVRPSYMENSASDYAETIKIFTFCQIQKKEKDLAKDDVWTYKH